MVLWLMKNRSNLRPLTFDVRVPGMEYDPEPVVLSNNNRTASIGVCQALSYIVKFCAYFVFG